MKLKRIFFTFVIFANIFVIYSTKPFVFEKIEDVPQKYCVLVLGAGVRGEIVSDVLRDRLESAAKIVKSKKAQRILISGDHGRKNYDEVNTALLYLRRRHGFDENVFLDHAGFSTWETAVRAKKVFCVDECTLVTQKFHIYRAVFLARKAGIDCAGLCAEEIAPFPIRAMQFWAARETLARAKAVLDAIFQPSPKFLGEQIPITGSAEKTRDKGFDKLQPTKN